MKDNSPDPADRFVLMPGDATVKKALPKETRAEHFTWKKGDIEIIKKPAPKK